MKSNTSNEKVTEVLIHRNNLDYNYIDFPV